MSRSLRLVLCLYLWWAIVILPALLVVAGVFGHVVSDDVPTTLSVLWVVAWVAQVGVLYVASRILGHVREWWFVVASMLPWAVSWSAAYGIGWGLLWIAIAGIDAGLMAWFGARSLTLDERGTVVTAVVKKVLKGHFNVVVNNVYVQRKVLLSIPGSNGATYEGKLTMLCEFGITPEKGDKLSLRVDPKNPQHFALNPRHDEDD